MNIDNDIGENPTPEQVRDYYDLHTAEGANNFSREDRGIAVQLWHSLAWALEDKAKLEDELDMRRQWGEEVSTLNLEWAKKCLSLGGTRDALLKAENSELAQAAEELRDTYLEEERNG